MLSSMLFIIALLSLVILCICKNYELFSILTAMMSFSFKKLTLICGGNSLHPGLYHAALDSPKYYMFTGGGTVLKVLEEGDPFGLPTVKALIANGEAFGYQSWLAGFEAV